MMVDRVQETNPAFGGLFLSSWDAVALADGGEGSRDDAILNAAYCAKE
jgi:hypothetical protein